MPSCPPRESWVLSIRIDAVTAHPPLQAPIRGFFSVMAQSLGSWPVKVTISAVQVADGEENRCFAERVEERAVVRSGCSHTDVARWHGNFSPPVPLQGRLFRHTRRRQHGRGTLMRSVPYHSQSSWSQFADRFRLQVCHIKDGLAQAQRAGWNLRSQSCPCSPIDSVHSQLAKPNELKQRS